MKARRVFCTGGMLLGLLVGGSAALADGPKDNSAAQVRPIPPAGNALAPADREALQAGLDDLGRQIDSLRGQLKDNPKLLAYLPDVQIYYNAVHFPLAYHETIDPAMGRKAIADGMARAKAMKEGNTPWTRVTAPRGYISQIDGSVQPYVLGIPPDYSGDPSKPLRLDVWSHGRDELLTELRFVEQDDYLHENKSLHQDLEPKGRFILSLYGRYINAYKFAGEVDGLEAMDAVKRLYSIDENRILVIGFSMGGAASWEYAVHYTDLWAAASPAAGFAETPEFLRVFQKEDVSTAPWYQQALWHLYDCTDYVANLANLPTIAYGGELDPQKQASDIMLKAAAAEGVKLDRIVGRQMGHHYTPEAKQELDALLDAILAKGRNPVPPNLRFTTWTLRYNRMYWITVDGLEHHWQRARADGGFTMNPDGSAKTLALKTQNVSALTLSFGPGQFPFAHDQQLDVQLDGQRVSAPPVAGDRSWTAHYRNAAGQWKLASDPVGTEAGLQKMHGLQGPIDDAFMSRFIFVRPTGKPSNEKTGAWAAAECDHAIEHWRRQFRGYPLVKDDDQVTDADMAGGNIVLFGDPASNKVLARLAARLPIGWDAQSVTVGGRRFDAGHHVPVLIYPNPLHPNHYIVLNSGFTYREYDYLNNARQTPKLPDYAVIDVDVPVTSQAPGGIATAGFFDEHWKLQPDDGKAAVNIGERSYNP